jgi:hypothetical protein
MHEINPVKFGGSQIDSSNKIVLAMFIDKRGTPWWISC